MTQHAILASFLVEADTPEEAAEKAQAFIEYGLEVSNDDGAIVAAGAETADATTVWVAFWDVGNCGSGVDVWRSQNEAVASVLDSIEDEDLERAGMTRDEAWAHLMQDGWLHLEWREDYYSVRAKTINP
jgi:hypothetical protein